MNSERRADLLETITELCRRYPHWRLGQLVANVAGWADQDVWDVEDEQLLAAAQVHLQQLGAFGGGGARPNNTRHLTGAASPFRVHRLTSRYGRVNCVVRGYLMRRFAGLLVFGLACAAIAADVESRQLTHYLPQDVLEEVVRKEDWTEVALTVKGGVRAGDVVRVWAGGVIDRGDADQPGLNVNGPDGAAPVAGEKPAFALSGDAAHAYALLFKTESAGPAKCLPSGKPLEIKLTKDGEKLWIGFNDQKGRYQDNHLGKGRRHELDPLWVRIEVVRMTVD